jgi:hypothetical protein
LGSRRRARFGGSRRIRIGELSPGLCGPLSVRSARPTRPAFSVSAASRPATAMASGQTGQPPRQYTTLQRSVRAILKQPGRHPRPCRPRLLTERAPFSSNLLSLAMVLTAIPTAIRGRLGVFAGIHCRTDSLQVRISGHRPTAADASPVTGVKGSRVQISPARPKRSTPSDLVGPAFNRHSCSVTSASQPVASRKVAVVITLPLVPTTSHSSRRRSAGRASDAAGQ